MECEENKCVVAIGHMHYDSSFELNKYSLKEAKTKFSLYDSFTIYNYCPYCGKDVQKITKEYKNESN